MDARRRGGVEGGNHNHNVGVVIFIKVGPRIIWQRRSVACSNGRSRCAMLPYQSPTEPTQTTHDRLACPFAHAHLQNSTQTICSSTRSSRWTVTSGKPFALFL